MVQIEVGTKIRELRKKLKLSLQAFAERVGVSYGYLGQVERGEKAVNATIIFGIRREFGVDLGAPPVGGPREDTKICEPGDLYSVTGFVRKVSIEEEELLKCWEKIDEGSRRTLMDVAKALAERKP